MIYGCQKEYWLILCEEFTNKMRADRRICSQILHREQGFYTRTRDCEVSEITGNHECKLVVPGENN